MYGVAEDFYEGILAGIVKRSYKKPSEGFVVRIFKKSVGKLLSNSLDESWDEFQKELSKELLKESLDKFLEKSTEELQANLWRPFLGILGENSKENLGWNPPTNMA